MKEIVGAAAVEHRPYVGVRRGGSLWGDTAATIGGIRSNFDYPVMTVNYDAKFAEPTIERIDEDIDIDKARGTRALDRFLFWEDHSDEIPHLDTNHLSGYHRQGSGCC